MKNEHRIFNPLRAEKIRLVEESRKRKRELKARVKNSQLSVDEMIVLMSSSAEEEGLKC